MSIQADLQNDIFKYPSSLKTGKKFKLVFRIFNSEGRTSLDIFLNPREALGSK